MRKLVTLLLLAANIYLITQIYGGWKQEQTMRSGQGQNSGFSNIPLSRPDHQSQTAGNPASEQKKEFGTYDAEVIKRFHEFDWYREDVMNSGIPRNKERIEDPSAILGRYHAYVLYNPGGESSEMLSDVEIAAGQSDLTVLFQWVYMYSPDTGVGEEDHITSAFRGSLEEGTITASGPGELTVTQFYYEDGTIRGLGSMETVSKEPALLALEKQ